MTFRLDIQIEKTLHSGARRFELRVAFACERERVVLLGASGSGKSLTLQAVAGLLRPDRGRIRLDGRSLFDSTQDIDLPPQARRLGYLFQDYALFPHLTVRQNIAFGCSRGWFNPHPDYHDPAVERWLDALELRPLAGQRPDALSGGQRQRVALARALAASPRALLLDEPFAALDSGLRERMRQLLDEVQRDTRLPLVLISHDPADAERFGDQVVRIEHGCVQHQAEFAA